MKQILSFITGVLATSLIVNAFLAGTQTVPPRYLGLDRQLGLVFKPSQR